MKPKYLGLCLIISFLVIITSVETLDAEELEKIEVEIKYTNGDRADHSEIKLLVYQDFNKEVFLEKKLESNPDVIMVPENHRYKIEVFVNGIYADVEYVQLDNTSKKIQINIPLSGGLKINVFYEDGETPIEDARVVIKTFDNAELRQGITNKMGETLRYWIQSTVNPDEYYIVDVYLGEIFLKSQYPVKLLPGSSINEKIIVGVPKIVEDLITVTLYNNSTNKVSSSNDKITVTLNKKLGNESITSNVDFRGQAKFSNLKTGTYNVKIEPNLENLWPETEIQIIGKDNQFNIFKKEIQNVSEKQELSHIESCNCVAFRFDDVQDYWLNKVQIQFMQVFVDKNIPLTIGVISDSFGNDLTLLDFVKSQKNNKFDIANHGIGNNPFTEFVKEEQDAKLKLSMQLLKEKLGIDSKVFIPPQNRFNEDTKQVLSDNGFTHISSSLLHGDPPPFPLKGEELYQFPEIATTGTFEPDQNIFVGISHEQTFTDVINGLDNYGFAVITSHPQEFSKVVNGTYVNESNLEQILELKKLIERIESEGIQIVLIREMNLDSQTNTSEQSVPVWIKNNARWWADGTIEDKTFVQGIEYMVKNGIIKVSEKSQTNTSEQSVPVWIKNNARWWADGTIEDKTFVQGIEYMVKNGIILY
ncbi:polysaccharide deacetylase family protein [Nitrosopumilus sp.]|uniref:polysaccharide deacetylase family protein n=1 Tax=Nitrosopumilus sp. TaxID=2024843 RepID=UPI00247DB436|nr:polysaccharide deacetylase family protein [Nitrosopumilus sp.]MCV0430045.1 DUF2334 domain-containing protein [Nitrosopumilus sp.]